MPRGVLIGLVAVLVTVGLVLVALWAFQRRLIYLPSAAAVPPAELVLPGAQEVRLHTADGAGAGRLVGATART